MRAWNGAGASLVLGAVVMGGASGASACAGKQLRAPVIMQAATQPASANDLVGEWQINWDRELAGWWPAIFHGTLNLSRDGSAWAGRFKFRESTSVPELFESIRVDGDRIAMVFTLPNSSDTVELSGWVREGRLVGEIRWGALPWTAFGARRMAGATRCADGAGQ